MKSATKLLGLALPLATILVLAVLLTGSGVPQIGPMPDMYAFRRRFAVAGAGLDELGEDMQARIMQLAGAVDEDLLGPFLVIAKAAHAGETEVDEGELARAYGTSSPGRIRRLLDHLERQGLIVVREDFGGSRTVMVPGLEGLPAE